MWADNSLFRAVDKESIVKAVLFQISVGSLTLFAFDPRPLGVGTSSRMGSSQKQAPRGGGEGESPSTLPVEAYDQMQIIVAHIVSLSSGRS